MNLRHLGLISYPDSLSYSMFVDPFKPLWCMACCVGIGGETKNLGFTQSLMALPVPVVRICS